MITFSAITFLMDFKIDSSTPKETLGVTIYVLKFKSGILEKQFSNHKILLRFDTLLITILDWLEESHYFSRGNYQIKTVRYH